MLKNSVRRLGYPTNNPDKVYKMSDLGVIVEEIIPLEIHSIEQNKNYLKVKKERMSHNLSEFN